MDRLRLGIIGTGRIVRRVMTDMGNCRHVSVTAIASREKERAEAAAREYGIPYAYAGYEALALSDRVDAVYIATPNPFHEEQALLMMNHKKHVICEKPMALNTASHARMADAARKNGVFLMEAMWTRFMPAVRSALALVKSGGIGVVRHVFCSFCFSAVNDGKDRLFTRELGGGSLPDVGIYCLNMARQLLGESVEMKVTGQLLPTGVDSRACAVMKYPGGATAGILCATDTAGSDELIIYGSSGVLRVPEFWRATRYTVEMPGHAPVTHRFRAEHEGHHYEFDHAAECISGGLTESPVMPLSDSAGLCRDVQTLRRALGVRYPDALEG